MAALVGITPRSVSAADGAVVAGEIRIIGFKLSNGASAATCTVQDDNGDTVWIGNAVAAGSDTIIFPSAIHLNGHKVSAVTGTLLIYMN